VSGRQRRNPKTKSELQILLIFQLFFAYFPLKNKRRLMRSLCCLSVCVSVSVHLSTYPPNFFSRLIRSLCCLCVPHIFFVFYATRVVSKECRRLQLPRTSCFYLPYIPCVSTLQSYCKYKVCLYSILSHVANNTN
jgi:hypothetical protein